MPISDVLINAGLQLPEIPFIEVLGSNGAGLFRQIGPMAAKIAFTASGWVIVSEAVAVFPNGSVTITV